jgi:FkbM family methyltransferase
MPVLGGINRGSRWIAGSGPVQDCWIGGYESDHMDALRKYVKPGAIVYDLGANAGYYTLALSRLVGSAGHVFSFEPDSHNADALRRHIQLNKLTNVSVVQSAVSNASGLVGFTGVGAGAEISSGSNEYLIPTITLNQFISWGNPSPSFIKMDIEGAEHMALDGATTILAERVAVWLVATHSVKLRIDCQAKMAEYGYRFLALDCVSDGAESGEYMAVPSAT